MTDDQLAQCRKEYDEWCEKEGWTPIDGEDPKWEIWRGAWRPVPTVEQIEDVLLSVPYRDTIDPEFGLIKARSTVDFARAIHAAFGGKNE